MLYTGGATVPEAIESLRKAGVDEILALPMFPQYCGASTGAVFDQVSAALHGLRYVPGLRFISSYHEDAAYIAALAASVRESMAPGADQHLLMSFHGVPERYVAQGDPYRDHCLRTAALLARHLGLADDAWSVAFQSRFGRARWLQPYTSEVLAGMPKRGIRNVSVICPGFVADCLETLEEIGMENRDVFLAAGGEKYQYIAALNARPDHVAALEGLVLRAVRREPGVALAQEASACSG
jgi:protoporphyrin/coproporphyrin ferrochelatase